MPRGPRLRTCNLDGTMCSYLGDASVVWGPTMAPLLKLLRENAAIKPVQLAVMLNSTEADVKARIGAYEAEHVILGYRAVLDEDKLDRDIVRAVIEVKITPE